MKKHVSISLFMIALSLSAFAVIHPRPYVIPSVVNDRQEAQVPDRVQLSGMLGARIHANTYTRLLETVDVDRLLQGYRKRPGCMEWDGEHIGKYLHAASIAWANSGDEKLRAKIKSAVTELIKCQEADGYLGTYLPDNLVTTKPVSVEKVVVETDEYLDDHSRGGILRGGSYFKPQGSVWYFPNKIELNTHGKLLLMAPSKDRAGTLGFRCVVDAGE